MNGTTAWGLPGRVINEISCGPYAIVLLKVEKLFVHLYKIAPPCFVPK